MGRWIHRWSKKIVTREKSHLWNKMGNMILMDEKAQLPALQIKQV